MALMTVNDEERLTPGRTIGGQRTSSWTWCSDSSRTWTISAKGSPPPSRPQRRVAHRTPPDTTRRSSKRLRRERPAGQRIRPTNRGLNTWIYGRGGSARG